MAPKEGETHVQVRSGHRRLLSLPFDVLIRIIILTAKDYLLVREHKYERRRKTFDQVIGQLSLVCRTFKDVITNTAFFWTEIDETICLRDNFKDLIARSKSALLQIDIRLSKDNWKETLSRIVPYRDRWQRLKLRFTEVDATDVSRTFPELEFPCLEDVELVFKFGEDQYEAFFMEWHFPRARSLVLEGAVPPLGLLPRLKNLRMFIFDTTREVESLELLEKLVAFLDHTKSIDVLEIGVSGIYRPVELPVVELPNIKKVMIFNIKSSDDDLITYGIDVVGCLIRSLKMPSIERYHLMIDFTSAHTTVDQWISSFDSDADDLESVTHVYAFDDGDKFDETSLVDFMSLFPEDIQLVPDVPCFWETLKRSNYKINTARLNDLVLCNGIESEELIQEVLEPTMDHPQIRLLRAPEDTFRFDSPFNFF